MCQLLIKCLLCIGSLSVLIKYGQCQTCEMGGTYDDDCVCKNITGKFPKITSKIYSLNCVDCTFEMLNEHTFENVNKIGLDIVNISHSALSTISESAFKNFKDPIMGIILEDNEIRFIAPGVFSKFQYLIGLNLKHNQISDECLRLGSFRNTKVQSWDLSFNRLSSVNYGFEGVMVNRLNVSHNQLTYLFDMIFDGMIYGSADWRPDNCSLDISYNTIKKINSKAFSGRKFNYLQHLFLNNNNISVIENGTFSDLRTLNTLNLGNNVISVLDVISFEGLQELTKLDLSNNNIRKLPEGVFFDLVKLTKLSLSTNKITQLHMQSFYGLISLEEIDLTRNSLKTIDPQALLPLGILNISSWIIDDNFWTCRDLENICQVLNCKAVSFSNPTLYLFDIPSFDGIACSKHELNDYEGMTFDKFLKIVSQSESSDDKRGYEEDDSVTTKRKGLYEMYDLIVILAILTFVIICVVKYLYCSNN